MHQNDTRLTAARERVARKMAIVGFRFMKRKNRRNMKSALNALIVDSFDIIADTVIKSTNLSFSTSWKFTFMTSMIHEIRTKKTAKRIMMFTKSKTDQKSLKYFMIPTDFILLYDAKQKFICMISNCVSKKENYIIERGRITEELGYIVVHICYYTT